ncbi:uncharacterized protein LOC136023602 isoform X4 [Lathamus discolor]|uniref:uncharacterized protein LOC136023602 isoform X4 n=1 Tax=Lathamus discolor TaxID=678569 RepID=UPI0032B7755F
MVSPCPQFGRTEVIDNSLNPDFLHKFVLDYFFEEKQNLRFDLYDVDSKSPDLSKHDFLGQTFCTLGEIVGSAGGRLEKPLTMGAATTHSRRRKPAPALSNGGIPGKSCGTIIVLAEELGNCRDVATLQFCANKLDKKDFFGKSDPFLVFYRSNEDGTFTICHRTEVARQTLAPVWAAFDIPVRALCNGDPDRTIKVEVYDWDRSGSHDFIGEFTTSYRELARGERGLNVYELPPSPPGGEPQEEAEEEEIPELGHGDTFVLLGGVRPQLPGLHQGRDPAQLHRCHRLHRIQREPVPTHVPALPEPLPAQRLHHGPQGGGGDHPGLRQRQDVPGAGLRCQDPTGRARVPRVPIERGCGEPGVQRHRGRAGGLSPEPAPRPALRAHQLRPRRQPRGARGGRGARWLPVLRAPHHHRRRHLGHGADQGGHRQRRCAPHVHHHRGGRPGRVRCHGGAGWGRHPRVLPREGGREGHCAGTAPPRPTSAPLIPG